MDGRAYSEGQGREGEGFLSSGLLMGNYGAVQREWAARQRNGLKPV